MSRLKAESQPILHPKFAQELGIHILAEGRRPHFILGRRGATRLLTPNPYGDTSIVADVVSERAMIDAAENSRVPLLIVSEEHGKFTVNVASRKRHKGVLVLDGDDGSSATERYLLGSTDRLYTRHGGMAAIAPVPYPRYGQFVWSGMYETVYQGESGPVVPMDKLDPDTSGRLVYATKGQGTFSRTPDTHEQLLVPILTPEESKIGSHTAGHYLELDYWKSFDPRHFEKFAEERGMTLVKNLSTGSMAIDVLTGLHVPDYVLVQNNRTPDQAADDRPRWGEVADGKPGEMIVVYLDPTRKGNEEAAATVLWAEEAGGVARTLVEGVPTDVSSLSFLGWNQDWLRRKTRRSQPVVIAVNQQIADTILLASHGMLKSQLLAS